MKTITERREIYKQCIRHLYMQREHVDIFGYSICRALSVHNVKIYDMPELHDNMPEETADILLNSYTFDSSSDLFWWDKMDVQVRIDFLNQALQILDEKEHACYHEYGKRLRYMNISNELRTVFGEGYITKF